MHRTGAIGQDMVSGLTSKQRELLVKCKLNLRLLDPAFLDAAGQDKKAALIRALEVSTAWTAGDLTSDGKPTNVNKRHL